MGKQHQKLLDIENEMAKKGNAVSEIRFVGGNLKTIGEQSLVPRAHRL